MTDHPRRFVIVSGLPGSGKSTLARSLSPLLSLPVIDKDDILEQLFEQKGAGDVAWRRQLSRESDTLFQSQAATCDGAVLVSFWRVPGMAESSGTPTEWLPDLSTAWVHVHCVCPPEVAAERFHQRRRHPGHCDVERPFEELLAGLQELERLGPPELTPRIDVNTAHGFQPEEVARKILQSFGA